MHRPAGPGRPPYTPAQRAAADAERAARLPVERAALEAERAAAVENIDIPETPICCGSATHSISHAQMLLQSAMPTIVKKILVIATEDERKGLPPCPLCGGSARRPEELQLKAQIALMDRGGMGPSSKIEVEQVSDDRWVEFCTDEEAEVVYGIMQRAIERMGNAEVPDPNVSVS